MSKPRIVYTTRNFSLDPLQYLIDLSIRCCGAQPVRVTPDKPHYDTDIDGLVIGGGTDLFPALYKFDPKPDYEYDHARDELEIAWLKRAENKELPILGICRGAQLLNVRRGGTLHTDVSKVYENAKYPTQWISQIFYRKAINIERGTLMRDILETARIKVNSMHKQAIDDVGEGLIISAKEDNGVVQAIEDPDKPFYLGVQFHPEALIYDRIFRGVFRRLIKHAGAAEKRAA